MIPPRPNRLTPLLAGLAAGAILAGAGLALAVDTPRSAVLDGTGETGGASVAPTVDNAPILAVPSTVDVQPTVGVQPTGELVPRPLPRVAAPDRAIDGTTPRAEPSTPTRPPTPPKATPTDAGGPGAERANTQASAPSAQQTPDDTITAVVAATNAERVSAGCLALRVDDRISTVAQQHSVDMADRSTMSHIGGDGSTFADRLHAAGYPRPGAENIAFGQLTAAGVVAAWMDSSGHRRNILNCEYAAIGVGFDPRGNYWTQNFGF